MSGAFDAFPYSFTAAVISPVKFSRLIPAE
jgi:hypothetical protein